MPADPLSGKRFLMFVDDDYEDLELWYPKLRLAEAGAQVTVAGPEAGSRYTGKHGYPCTSDAGAIWEDAPLVVDRHFVSSRKPDDLPQFCQGILQVAGP